ncbi:MAG: oligosaccharide flippase family protein [Xanthomonadales bacterium]|nr:oligosaccharide flippase family protein [Xanthomonadales bacterium]
MSARRDLRHAALLTAANLATMLLPLAALPLLAQRVGVHAFGQIALAQTVGMIAALLVDAGFNAESMRATGASGLRAPLQPLLDNVLARTRLALPAAALTLLGGAWVPGLPLAAVALSLLQLLGTLLFAQWWLIACGRTALLLALQLAGRLAALGGIVLWVHGPQDLLLAVALQCGATALSGLLFVAVALLPRAREFAALDRHGHRAYLARVRPAVGPGFAAALSSYAPQLLLGGVAGPQQVGLYAAAEKIVRAIAFAVSSLDQAFLAPVARRAGGHGSGHGDSHGDRDRDGAQRLAMRVVGGLFAVTALGSVVLALLAAPLLPRLFGPAFAGSVGVLAVLCAWLPSYAARRAFVNLWLSADGRIALVGRSQSVEAIATTAGSAIGALAGGAIGAACGLVAAEAVCWLALRLLLRPLAPPVHAA